MTIRLVIFDCDGVLFDSEPANLAFYREVLRRAGAPPMPESVEAAYHSLASSQLFEKIFADQPAMLATVKQVARETSYAPFFPLMQPKPLLRETLLLLRSRYATAMATNRGQTTQGVVDYFAMRDLFDLAVGVLDVARPKPEPDMLHRCLDYFGVDADEAVYVGDQPTDLEAAEAATIHFIGMGPMCGRTPLSAQRFEEIPDLVAGLA
ncbi:MAG TPA: HAD family hydrolase [Candidatus Limnocylindrales bacterium]|nr:HAD family hydrolase [Candidatus Limnocylindrales bacterium]